MTTLVAHRGYSSKYPENTMRAFRAAYDSGFRNIELDVHVNADGVPVVVHNWADVGRVENPLLQGVAQWAFNNAVTLFVDIKKESIAKHGREKVTRLVSEACRGCLWVPVSFDCGIIGVLGRGMWAGTEPGSQVRAIESIEGMLPPGTAVYTAETQNEIRLLHALGARWVMVDDCGLAEGLPEAWLV